MYPALSGITVRLAAQVGAAFLVVLSAFAECAGFSAWWDELSLSCLSSRNGERVALPILLFVLTGARRHLILHPVAFPILPINSPLNHISTPTLLPSPTNIT